jgi:O-6-methylguanine DNA methyltransferase
MILSFPEKIYNIVKKIPKGKVLTYKQVAELAGRPEAYRAVGNILNKNTNPEVPCHRVIRSDGKIGGYNQGTKTKRHLLINEGMVIRGCGIVR